RGVRQGVILGLRLKVGGKIRGAFLFVLLQNLFQFLDGSRPPDGDFQGGLYLDAGGKYGNFDGGRGDVLRYDSPSVAGFIFSTSWSDSLDASDEDSDYFDVALRYSGEFNAFRLAAAVGYTDDHDESEILQGSVSIMHVPTGLFAAFQAGNKELASGAEGDLWYVTAGIEKTWLSYGKTTIYGEYGQYNDAEFEVVRGSETIDGVDDTMWGVGLVQSFDSAALDIYLQYRHVEEDDAPTSGGDELDTFLLGTNITF
nr:porin [Hyphomicrobiales bacterium]